MMPATRLPVGRPQIAGVQVWRALAALSVAFLHIEQAAGAFVGTPGQSPWPLLRAVPWEAGVDVFFVISGFVMVYSSERLFGSARSIRPFLGRRVARVVPLYWIATTLTVAVAVLRPGMLSDGLGSDWRMILASYLFVPWPHSDGALQPVFRLGWTLNYEMLFYLIFAAFLVYPRRLAVLGTIAAIAGLIAAGKIWHPAAPQLVFWTDPVMAEFAFGVVLGALRLEDVALPLWLRLALPIVGLAIFGFIGPDATADRALGYGAGAACLIGAVVLGPVRVQVPRLERVWALLGDSSYALYLLHPFPMRGLRELWARLHFVGSIGIVTYIAAAMLLSAALAVAVHLWVERPLLRRVRAALGV